MERLCSYCERTFDAIRNDQGLCTPCFNYIKLTPEEQFKVGPPDNLFGYTYRDAEGNSNVEYEQEIEGDIYCGNLPEHEEFNNVTIASLKERKKAWDKLQARARKNQLRGMNQNQQIELASKLEQLRNRFNNLYHI